MVDLKKLRELNEALKQELITEEEYRELKENMIKELDQSSLEKGWSQEELNQFLKNIITWFKGRNNLEKIIIVSVIVLFIVL